MKAGRNRLFNEIIISDRGASIVSNVRRAKDKDIPAVFRLLKQVNKVHHDGRPDLFKWPATKYTEQQLQDIFTDDRTPVFVCTDEKDQVLGYAFCILKQAIDDNILTDIKSLYIDGLCVDETIRGQHIGSTLYQYVLDYARSINCYNVTLNVWSLNTSAMKFYEKCGLIPQKVGMEVIL